MIEVIPFNEGYLKDFEYDGVEVGLFKDLDLNKIVTAYAKDGKAVMGYIDGELIGFAGIMPITSWLGFSWAFLNRKVREQPFEAFDMIEKYGNKFIKELGLHRVETQAPLDSYIACKLLEVLGYKNEGIMKAFGKNREDYVRYAKVIP